MLPPDAPLPPTRLRIGQCTVDVSSREIRAPDTRRPLRVTPKAMAVLLVLVDSGDRVVSRDTLLAAVWPDTLPSDDVLTQAVTQLRKAFQEVRGDSRYIETIAKGGYRLLAEVEDLGGAGTDAPAPVPDDEVSVAALLPSLAADSTHPEHIPPTLASDQATPLRYAVRRRWRGAVIAMLILAMAMGGYWWLEHRQIAAAANDAMTLAAPARIEPFLITSAPGFELAPTLSPGGGLVAYMAVPEGQRNIAIMLQSTAPVAPRQLTFPEGMAEDAMPRWSPDGRDIAFLRVTPGRDCRLMVVRATGRAERIAGTCDPDAQPGYDWTPDGKGLILDRGEHPGLQILDLASGTTRAVAYGADPDYRDVAPRYSPDGRWIVFLRNLPSGDFWRIPAGGGPAERLTRMGGEIRGWDWTPDGQGLVYARRTEGVSRMYRFQLSTGVHTALGVEDSEQPSMARNVPALAYVVRHPRFGIYRFSTGADSAAASGGERLFASSGRDRVPSIAPDGRQLVFVSDRAGPLGLWWGEVDEPTSLRLLEGIRPDSRQPASWSSDSARVLLVGTAEPGSGSQAGDGPAARGVYEVDPARDRVRRLNLPVEAPEQALYAPGPEGPDQRLLVLADGGDGRLRLSLFADAAHPETAIATLDDVVRVQVDAPRDRLLFARRSDPGLWQASLDLNPDSVRRLSPGGTSTPWHDAWASAGDGGTYMIRRTPGCSALLTHDRGDSTQASAAEQCLDPTRRAATRAFTFNPRTRRIYLTLAEYDGGDIGFATLEAAEPARKSGSSSH